MILDEKDNKKSAQPDEACIQMAALIGQELLPKTEPRIAGADISGWTLFCHALGGDFFDYLDFSGVCCQAESKMKIVVGDACGHGLCSALVMTSTRSYLRARAMQPGDLPQVITDVNRLLCMDLLGNGLFVSLFYAEIDTQKRKFEWVRAGHPPALLFNPLNQEFISLYGTGMALGVDPRQTYQKNCRADLQDGTIILIGSDGLWELPSGKDDLTTRQIVIDLVVQYQHDNAVTIAEAVKNVVNERGGAAPLEDDVTLIVVKFGPSLQEVPG